MSYNGMEDADLPLKLQLSNYLWNQGYVCRPCIPLYHYSEGKRTSKSFTDIDVLGIKFTGIEKPRKVVCSAKSGEDSDTLQLFWLSGVKSYFDADEAIYIRSKGAIYSVTELLKKLEIRGFNQNELNRLMKNMRIDVKGIRYINSLECYTKTNKSFIELKKLNIELYRYLTERYWIEPPHLGVLRTIDCVNDIISSKLDTISKKFLTFYCISLFIMSLIQIINKLSSIPNEFFINSLETELMGGEYSERDKRILVSKIEAFMRQFVKLTKSEPAMSIDRIFDSSTFLKIPYSAEISDLCTRLRESSSILMYLPQLFDIMAFEIFQQDLIIKDNSFIQSINNFDEEEKRIIGKAIKDVLFFYEQIKFFNRSDIKILIDVL